MASRNNDSVEGTADTSRDSTTDKSFVGKFVSGILNSGFSKWFGSGDTPTPVRRREDDDEDDGSCSFQPPLKRAKLLSRGSEDQRDNSFPQFYGSPLTSSVSQNSSSTNVHNNMVPPSYNHFPEPVAGPSGINSRRSFTPRAMANVNTQSHPSHDLDSESDDSTDGYLTAPRLPKTRRQDDTPDTSISAADCSLSNKSLQRSNFDVNPTRSLFSDRSLSPRTISTANTSLSSRRPAFNSSTFGTPSFVDRTLTTQRIMSSPFYIGQTTYGGAAAHGRRIPSTRASPSSVKSVQIKPVNEKTTSNSSGSNSSLSLTARRILNTLEQYSTPISDAKKIPVQTPKERQEGILSRYVGANPYLVRDRSKKAGPSNRELQVPSIPELLRQKQRLQNTTVNVRQIATHSKSSLNDQSYSLRPMEEDTRTQPKRSNKMKSSVSSSVRQQRPMMEEAPMPAINLPKITFPKMIPPPVIPPLLIEQPKKTEKPAAKESNNNNSGTDTSTPSDGKCCYKFSSPVVLRENSQGKTIPSINCFKFSEPKVVDPKFRLNGENVRSEASSPAKGFGSQFKLSCDKWECDICMVRNNNTDLTCVACTNPKPKSNNGQKDTFTPSSKLPPMLGATGQPLSRVGFGDAFKLPSSTWECTVCMIRNKDDLVKCAACETPKSSGGASKTTAAPVPSFGGFGDKFKTPSDTWECPTCMIRNKNELQKCVACETQRQQQQKQPQSATTFTTSQAPNPITTTNMMDKFKPASDTWECPTCMIRNKNELNRCAACESTRPGASTEQPQSTFSFGISKPADGSWECTTCLIKNKSAASKCAACEVPKNGFGDRFKTDDSKWECSSCMVKNQQDNKECVCCGVPKPGSASMDTSKLTSNKSVLTFNFGVDTSGPKFQFGIPPASAAAAVATTTTTTIPAKKAEESPAPATGFVFGTPTKVTPVKVDSSPKAAETPKALNPLLRPEEKLPEKATAVAASGFTFGVPSSSTVINTESTVASTPPTFSFKPTTTAVNGDVSKIVFGAKPETADAKEATPSKTETPAAPAQFKFEAKTPSAAPQPAALFKFGVSPSNKRPSSDGTPNQMIKLPTPSNGFTIPEVPGFSKTSEYGTAFKFNANPATPATFKFGGSDNNQTKTIPAPAAAATASNTTTPFKFGSSSGSAAPAPAIGGFNFTAPATSGAAASSPGFNFGKTEAASSGGFGSPAAAASASNASAAKNGSFNFGPPVTNNNNQKAVFSFGASQTGQQQQAAAVAAAQPSFGQAAAAAAPAIAGGFNFTAAPTLGAPAGFNFTGAPPSFNFTDGSSSSAGPQRRFKRALRRTTPR